MSAPYDRPTSNPGGMDCQHCGVIFVGDESHSLCAVCAAKGWDRINAESRLYDAVMNLTTQHGDGMDYTSATELADALLCLIDPTRKPSLAP